MANQAAQELPKHQSSKQSGKESIADKKEEVTTQTVPKVADTDTSLLNLQINEQMLKNVLLLIIQEHPELFKQWFTEIVLAYPHLWVNHLLKIVNSDDKVEEQINDNQEIDIEAIRARGGGIKASVILQLQELWKDELPVEELIKLRKSA